MKKYFRAAIFLKAVFGAIFFCVAGAHAAVAQQSETTILSDATTTFAAGAEYWPQFSQSFMSPGPIAYHAGSPFTLSRILVDVSDRSLNNHNGVGNVQAWIYDAQGHPIASSTNVLWGEHSCDDCVFQFGSQIIPADFSLGLSVVDGIQGYGDFRFTNLRLIGVEQFIHPVVIVPGIMGSRLTRETDGSEVWPDVATMLLSPSDHYLDDLALDATGAQIPGREMATPSIIDEELGQPFYKNLIDGLTSAGYVQGTNLFFAPYDWRLDMASSAAQVGDAIRAAIAHSPDGTIDVFAHSFGGLVAKQYLADATSTGFLNKLIFAGVPQTGAPLAFKVLQYGDDLGTKLFGLISILNADEIKKIAQNMPGIYDLLPSRQYVGRNGGYIDVNDNTLDFDETTLFMNADPGDSRNMELLGQAIAAHARIDGTPVPAGAHVYRLVGCGNPTINNFLVSGNGVVDIVRGNGDGVVPVGSALDPVEDTTDYFFVHAIDGIDHQGLANGPEAVSLIKAILNGTDSETAALPSGVSTLRGDCDDGPDAIPLDRNLTIEIAAHGAVALGVYDSLTRHTGKNASGTIDVQIPESAYDAIGLNQFLLLPASEIYHVVANVLAPGTTTFSIRKYNKQIFSSDDPAITVVPYAPASTSISLEVASDMVTAVTVKKQCKK